MMGTFTETISGIRVVKAFAMEKFELKKFFKNTLDYLRTVVHFEALKLSISPLTEFLGAIAFTTRIPEMVSVNVPIISPIFS